MRANDFAPSEGARAPMPIAASVEVETNPAANDRATDVMTSIRAVLAARREPTIAESAALVGALNDPAVNQIEKKLLATLAAELERQANGRVARDTANAVVAGLQAKAQRVRARQERFDALDPMVRAAWLMQNAEFLRFAQLCSQDTRGAHPPQRFEFADSSQALFPDGRP